MQEADREEDGGMITRDKEIIGMHEVYTRESIR